MYRLDPKQALIDRVATRHADGSEGLSPAALEIIARPHEAALSSAVVAGVAQAIETLLIALIGLVAFLLVTDGSEPFFYLPTILGASVLSNVALNFAHTHRITVYRQGANQGGRVLLAWLAVVAVLGAGLYLFKSTDGMAWAWLGAWAAAGAAGLVAFRLVLRAQVWRWTKAGRLKRRTVIVGGGTDAEALIAQIRQGAGNDIALLGLFDDRVDDRSPDIVAGCPKLGRVSDLVDFARRTQIDLVLVSMPLSAEKRLLEMLRTLWVLPVDIRLSSHMSQLKFRERAYSYVGDLAVFDMADRPISDWNLVFKWIFDKVVALLALVLLSPAMIATAIAIKLESRGPVFFTQNRHGFNNQVVRIYKFRSMYTDRSDANASKLVTRNDPRVTRVGRFIRKTSIDELPQLFNVLKGELSIVGPRPHAMEAKADNALYYEAVEGYFARHRVKPGITGWAQIKGWRGETDTIDKIMQRVDHDLYYIERWSPLLDLYILVMTPVSLFSKSENAY